MQGFFTLIVCEPPIKNVIRSKAKIVCAILSEWISRREPVFQYLFSVLSSSGVEINIDNFPDRRVSIAFRERENFLSDQFCYQSKSKSKTIRSHIFVQRFKSSRPKCQRFASVFQSLQQKMLVRYTTVLP